jgi:non-ribosomal peptide synthetase component E (peptide arylation enzyme)
MVDYLKSMRLAMFKLPERLELIDSLPLAAGGQKIEKKILEQDIIAKLKKEGKFAG